MEVKRDHVLIIGHRGAAGHAPENTLSSIRKAIELGCDYVEVDLQETADGRIVAFHDKVLDRLTNATGYLWDHSFAELREGVLVGGLELIPDLDEVCSVIAEGEANLLAEVLVPGLEQKVVGQISNHLAPHRFMIGSFFHDLLVNVKTADSSIKTVALLEGVPIHLEKTIQDAECDFIGLGYESLDSSTVERVGRTSAAILTWTVDHEAEILRMHGFGVDGVISNYPDRVRNALHGPT